MKIIQAVIELSRGTRVARIVESVGEDYQELIDALRNASALPVGLMERSVHTDYVPWVREIITAEDAVEARQERWGRTTRNSARYIRSVELGDHEKRALLASSFEGCN